MRVHRWRAFYLAIDFSLRFQCADAFSGAVSRTPDNASERYGRSLFAPPGKWDEETVRTG